MIPIRSSRRCWHQGHAPIGCSILRPVVARRRTSHYRHWECSLLFGWLVSPALSDVSRRDGDRRLWRRAPQRADSAKVLQGAAPEDRAGMASGLASTTRFIGILVSVGVGAVLSDVASQRFRTRASKAGLAMDAAQQAAARVTSGDLARLLSAALAGRTRCASFNRSLRVRSRLCVRSGRSLLYRVRRVPARIWPDQQPGDSPGCSAGAPEDARQDDRLPLPA